MGIAVVLAIVLAACAFPGFEPDPVPPEAQPPQPIGPVIEVGRGEAAGVAWRYSFYESDMGACTRIETAEAGLGESCGGTVGPGIEAMSSHVKFGGCSHERRLDHLRTIEFAAASLFV